jgi:lysophospholipase L1-like esterase
VAHSLFWRRFALTSSSLLLALGACELTARIVLPVPPNPLRQPQIAYQYDPDLRYVYLPNQKGWIDDGFVTINSLGFRGAEVASPKPPGRFRTVVLGDSLTVGYGVSDGETYAAQLERLLHERFPARQLDVVNLGVTGYSTRQEVALLSRHLPSLQPDLVLVGFYTNDLPDALEDEPSSGPGGTHIVASNPQRGQVLHMAQATSWSDAQLRRSRLAYALGRTFRRLTGTGEWATSHYSMELALLEGKSSAPLDRAWQQVETRFGRLRSLADASKFSVAIVVLPCREQVMGQFPNALYQTRVRAIADRLGFSVVDPLPFLVASRIGKDALFVPYDRNHPSATGHRIIAESILEYVTSQEGLAVASTRVERGDF